MIYELRDFIPFIEFILNQDNKILDTPIYGELWIIGPLIQKSSNLRFTSTKDFLDYIIQFNIISGYLLEFSKDLNNNIDIKHLPKLISINFKGVLMLQSRLKGNKHFHKYPTPKIINYQLIYYRFWKCCQSVTYCRIPPLIVACPVTYRLMWNFYKN